MPRQLLDEANLAVEQLKKRLDEATILGRREMDTALQSMMLQLRTLQSQQKSTEEQLHRSTQREKELLKQLADSDSSTLVARLRSENDELHAVIEQSNRKLDALRGNDVQVETPLPHVRTPPTHSRTCARFRSFGSSHRVFSFVPNP